MADVCVDDLDFQVENGQLRLNPYSQQSAADTFVHLLEGPANVWEEITELDPVVVGFDGVYVVTFDARGLASITPANPGVVVNANVSAELRVNGVEVPATETRLASLSQLAPTTAQPQLTDQGTGSCTRVLQLNAGDSLTIWGQRVAVPGTSSQILSDVNGRCRITAHRIGGF